MVAIARMLLWHIVQPVMYVVVLWCNYSELDRWQKIFGVAVAIREGLYLLTILACVIIKPAFLLIDPWANVNGDGRGTHLHDNGVGFLLFYTS